MDNRISALMDNLNKNRMDVYYTETKDGVPAILDTLMTDGESVAVGGSVTLNELGILDYLRSGRFTFLDRYAPGLSREQIEEIFRRSFYADTYLTSSNAVTMDGELYNVDGNGNRINAITFGPKSVVVIVGINKIVPDLNAAILRVKTIAAPLNAQRLNKSTPCCKTGCCAGLDGGMTDGCSSPDRICASYLVTGKQIKAGRIKVIIVGESCGY